VLAIFFNKTPLLGFDETAFQKELSLPLETRSGLSAWVGGIYEFSGFAFVRLSGYSLRVLFTLSNTIYSNLRNNNDEDDDDQPQVKFTKSNISL